MRLLGHFVFTLFLLSLAPLIAAEPLRDAPVIDISKLSPQLLRSPAEFLVTDTDTRLADLPLEQFKPLHQANVNQGVSDKAYWLRFQLSNTAEQPVDWVLRHETAYIDNIEVFLQDTGQAQHHLMLSDRVPFVERPLQYRTLSFSHTTPESSATAVYLKLFFDKPDSVTLNLKLSTAEQFAREVKQEYFFFGGFYGAMLTLILISLIGALLLKQWGYLFYTLFLSASTLMWSLLNGFAFQFLWPSAVFWHNEGFHIIYLLVAATAFIFSRHFLMTRLHFPRLDRWLKWLPVIMLAAIGLRFAGVYEAVLYIAMLSITSMLLLSVLGLKAYLKGLTYARWYALAWLVYGAGLTLSVMSATTSLLSWGMDSLVYAQAGAVLEAMLLLFALADKLRSWETDHQQVLQLVHQDALTGISNRRAIPDAITALQNAFRQNGKPVYMALLDLDDFKRINDRFGHAMGDQVLKTLATLMQTLSRTEDVCIRQGGDEFMLLFQTNNDHQAFTKVERIRQIFNKEMFNHQDEAFIASLSSGISRLFSTDWSLSEQAAFKLADEALYEAKLAGGNQCRMALSDKQAEGRHHSSAASYGHPD
jgi:diguanylate cyclase (GGDEF)-like protein